ncbi:MAG: hypothetical protein ABR518_03360 [Actinomycetota bacterium]
MDLLRPVRATRRGLARGGRGVGRAVRRAPRALGRGLLATIRSRVLPWTLFVVAVAGALFMAQRWHEERVERGRVTAVTAVARDFLRVLTNFQAATIDRDVERIRSFAVGDFADQVDEFFNQEAIDGIRAANARSVGRVTSVFVQRLDGATASVFGVVNEVVTNSTSPTPSTEVVRFDIQMIQTAAGWKVSSVEILQSPTTAPLGG